MVKTIGARELKNRLGTYLREVREGARIIITDRGRPVAELRALGPAETQGESQLLQLAAQGLVSPPSRRLKFPGSPRIHISGEPLSKTLLEDREDRL